MQIDLSDSGCLTLLLSDEELAALGLSFEELDYDNPQTRRMLHSLLQLARQETGCPLNGTLVVEALPLEGGCLLLVTPEETPLLDEHTAPAVFWIADVDALLQLAAAWPHTAHPFGASSSLYRLATDDDAFLLVLYGGEEAEALYECAEPVADGLAAAAWAAEHGDALFIGDALPHLHRLVQRRRSK